jgi:hypothetical protein
VCDEKSNFDRSCDHATRLCWWFWDPVENAAFMPWVLATAYFHSVILPKYHFLSTCDLRHSVNHSFEFFREASERDLFFPRTVVVLTNCVVDITIPK